MILEQLPMKVSYMDVVLLLLTVGAYILFLRLRKDREKFAQLHLELANLQQQQEDLQGHFKQGTEALKEALKEVLFDKTRGLGQRITELANTIAEIRQKNDAVLVEIDGKVDPLKESFTESAAKIHASHDAMRKMIWDTREELKKLASHLTTFSQEIKRMKDHIRERSIDLEL